MSTDPDRGLPQLRQRAGGWLPVALAALLQWLPLATAPFLPFVDLPQHVAQAQLLLHMDDPAVHALYAAQVVPQVNALALYLLAPALAMLPEAAAVRLVLAVYVALLAWAVHRLARAAGASAWTAALALVFTVQFNLWYGFLSFCLGLPFLLLLVARWGRMLDASGRTPSRLSWRTVATDAALCWLLVLGHVLLLGFAVAAFAIGWLFAGGARRVAWRRALAMLPALAWLGWWMLTVRSTIAARLPGTGSGLETLWEGPVVKLTDLGRALLVASRPGYIEWLALAVVGGIALWLLRMERGAGPVSKRVAWTRSLSVAALLAYALLPYSIYERDRVTYGLFILYPRFAALVPFFLLLTLRDPATRSGRRSLAVLTTVVIVGLAVHWSALFRRAASEAAPIDAAIAGLQPGRTLKSLIFTPYPQGLRYEGLLHVASYYQARRLGETDQSFAALLASPVHYRDPNRHPYLSLQDEHLHPESFDPARVGFYDYLLLYRRGTPVTLEQRQVFARDGWRIESAGAAR